NYYNGLIFRGMLKGIPQVILSGGRYDNLLKRMNKPGRAIGFAVYLDLLERSEMAENEPVKTVSYTENSDPAEILKQLKDLYDEGFTVQAVCDGGVQG
ncbi:MAG: ATP phosphoribosyltransferase regulatory subunit, partial [Solobacterium sp.]|nr:ATP phosphoribosyltransferase regulatory subunit [Solobacterium sp.]